MFSEKVDTSTTMPVIALEDVSLEFGGRSVLSGVNLTVQPGEFVAILGSSGGGKSTLLRLIAGLLLGRGTVRVTAPTAMVFQDYRLLPWRTVAQNVALPKELTGHGEDVTATLKQVGMLEFASLYPHQLSGGMRARVAIARALAQDAAILLMDEPFAALDALVRERFNLELKRLHHKTKKTIVFVTHSIREAVYLADRVVVLQNGRIETILDSRDEGRLTAFTDGLEAELRSRLGMPNSSRLQGPVVAPRFPWEVLGGVGFALLFVLLWHLSALQIANALVLPSPQTVWAAFGQNAGVLFANAVATLGVTVLGFVVALFVGVPLGYALGKRRALERLVSPFVVALQAIPAVIFAPLLVVFNGFGLGSKVTIAVLVCLFPILVNTMIGVREVDKLYREVFRSMRASRLATILKLELPGGLPVLLGGFKLSMALALTGAFVAELVLGGPGLGFLVDSERKNFRLENTYAAVLAMAALGTILYSAVAALEHWVLRYRRK